MSVQEMLAELPKLEPEELKLVRQKMVELEVARQAPKTAFGKAMLELAGTVEGLPSDASLNHDHYLYGTPKRA